LSSERPIAAAKVATMTLLFLAYVAGLLTIATPCIFPILPFVLARADEPFRRGGLPMLFGLAVSFAAAASLASVAGGWAVAASRFGRAAALALMTLFGLTMLFPALAVRVMAPFGSIGARLSDLTGKRITEKGATTTSSVLLGVATGLVWAPCAGPVLGLILSDAALRGPGAGTLLLLLSYGSGAATSLAAGVLLGGRVLAVIREAVRWADTFRRVLGAAIVAGAATIWLGLDTGPLTRWPSVRATGLEQDLVSTLRSAPAMALDGTAFAAASPPPSGPLFGAQQWLNTRPLEAADVRGKVVLVNFWTYSCINCLRMLPHVRAWAEKYHDRGLVVIGVHTPEFAFEKDVGNVGRAVHSLGVSYPVAIDNDFAIWRAFGNEGWPALYFIDADGRVRHQVVGEGGYDASERLLQQLLSDVGSAPAATDSAVFDANGPQAAADVRDLRSPETYLGYAQASNFVSPGGARRDVQSSYRGVPTLPLNRWALDGVWTVGSEFATLNDESGGITYRFHARDLHLVLAGASHGHPIRFRVTVDGAPPGADHGSDVDADGWGSVQDDRLYQLVRQAGAVTDRTFEIRFFEAGVRAYAFTFG
jgi:cytochrome c biogenesis protein CcdA/thiol-disulfide isomerase/thioredoxin